MHVVAAVLSRRIDGLLAKRDSCDNREQYKWLAIMRRTGGASTLCPRPLVQYDPSCCRCADIAAARRLAAPAIPNLVSRVLYASCPFAAAARTMHDTAADRGIHRRGKRHIERP